MINQHTKILLYADDTSIIVTSPEFEKFETQIGKMFGDINNWLKINQLVLNYNLGNYVKSSKNTKFWGLIIDDSISWKDHIDQMMSELNMARFVITTLQAIMSQETLRMVYFAYVHSVMSYGIIFWGNQPHSERIFKIQKRVIRIITNSRARDSCGDLLKKLEILP